MYRQMRYFIAVIENNSFYEAGEACHISQSAISQQVQALENELQVKLLERHGRKFTITPAGQYFYEQAKLQVESMDTIVREVQRIEKGEFLRLRVGVLNGFSQRIIHQTIQEFTKSCPHVHLSIATGTHEELFHSVNTGALDLVINDQWRALSDQYINEELMDQPLFALIRQDHPLVSIGFASLENLRDLFCVLVTSPQQRESETAHWRDVMGLQSNYLFAENVDTALMNTASGLGYYLCDADTPTGDGMILLPVLRGQVPLTRKMFAFWPESSDSSLQWEFIEVLHRMIQ